jgi:hypothetical protein
MSRSEKGEASLAYPRRPWSSPLNKWMNQVSKVWSKNNPLGLNETLLVMRAYVLYHHLYAVSMCFAIANNQADRVPDSVHSQGQGGWVGRACFVYFSSGMPFVLRMESMTAEISASKATNDSGAHCRSFIRLISSRSRALWDTPGTPR